MNNKFKAYNESEDKMSKPFSMPHILLNFTSEDGLGLMKTLTDEVILQFTGLKDKNGVDIYEGDILHHHRQGKCRVEYGNRHFDYAGFTLVNEKEMTNTLQDPCIYEVIGNIHQNPELLK